jgi:hypothetical protein
MATGLAEGGAARDELSRIGRPPKSLLARVLENSFRPGRYGPLLLAEPLPRTPPFRDQRRRELWWELRMIQRHCVKEPEHLSSYARDFSRLVCCLHGASPPSWYREQRERSQRRMEAFLASYVPSNALVQATRAAAQSALPARAAD